MLYDIERLETAGRPDSLGKCTKINSSEKGLHWLDELVDIFGPPQIITAPPHETHPLVKEYSSNLEAALFFVDPQGDKKLIISRPIQRSESHFNVSVTIRMKTETGIVIDGPVEENITTISVNHKEKSVTFFSFLTPVLIVTASGDVVTLFKGSDTFFRFPAP
jgi:hypothetical protein